MKPKKAHSKRIYLILCLLVFLGAALSMAWERAEHDSQPLTREREYPVQIGTITVGIDAAGSIQLNDTGVFLPAGLKIADFCVAPGQEVRQGEPLANVDPSSIRNVLEQLEGECEALLNALSKQMKTRNAYLTSSNTNIQRLRDQALDKAQTAQTHQQTYVASLKKQIESIDQRIENLNDILATLTADEHARIDFIQETQSAYIALKEQLQARLEEAGAQLDVLADDRESAARKETAFAAYLEELGRLDSEVNLAQDKYNQALENLGTVKSLLAHPVIFAPADGVVRSLDVEPNTEITQNPIMKIGVRTSMTLTLPIESADINDVAIGQKVEFYTDAYPAEKFTGTVTGKNLLPNADGKYEVYVQIDPTDAQLQQGMGAMATLIVMQKENVLTLSNKAIFLRDGRQYVTLRNGDGTLSEREITTGFSDGRVSEILGGLTAGEVVIVEDEIS